MLPIRLPIFAPYVAAGVPPGLSSLTIAQTDSAVDNTSRSNYDFAAKNFAIGAADASRIVVVDASARIAGTVNNFTGVTIGGVAGTLIDESRNTASSNSTITRRYQAAIPTGTTATVSVAFDAAFLRCGVIVYTILGSNGAAPTGADTTDGTSITSIATSPTVNVPSGGGVICGGALISGSIGGSVTPSNYTNTTGVVVINTNQMAITGGYDTSGNYGSRTYSHQWSGTSSPNTTFIASAWSP